MPELPEVETIVRRLRSLIVGRAIKDIEVRRAKSFQGSPSQIKGLVITDISRRAKIIRLHLSLGNLLIHLKMTGQLIFVDPDKKNRVGGGHPTADWVGQLPSKHTRVIIFFYNGSRLYFNDMRVFGWIRYLSDQQVDDYLSRYAPDVIDQNLTVRALCQSLQRRTISIKQAIMDSKIMSGVGNIYACDGLNLAKIDPRRKANSLSQKEVRKLLNALRMVVNKGIELEGASIDTYVKDNGLAGGYQDVLRVYGREGMPCPNCDGAVVRIKQGGRSTFYCPHCQH